MPFTGQADSLRLVWVKCIKDYIKFNLESAMKKILTLAAVLFLFCFITGSVYACEENCKCGGQDGVISKCLKTCSKTCKCHKNCKDKKCNCACHKKAETDAENTECNCEENNCDGGCKCNKKAKKFKLFRKKQIKCNCEE